MYYIQITEVETIKTADYGNIWLYGYRPKSMTVGKGPCAGSFCDNSAIEKAYAAIVAL